MKLIIKELEVGEVTQSYVDWFSDPQVSKYSENQYLKFTLQSQKKYVSECISNPDLALYGIFDNCLHIGNIVLKGLQSVHNRGEIGFVVGVTAYWGRGVASSAVAEIISIAKKNYKLEKLYGSVARPNIASAKVFEKNGFELEGTRKKHLLYGGSFYDQLDFGLVISGAC